MKYGICHLSTIALRLQPSHRSEMCTQLLFGEMYTVIDTEGDWLKVKCINDEYEGWMPLNQYYEVNEAYFESYVLGKHVVCVDDVAVLEQGSNVILICLGATLPFFNGKECVLGTQKWTYQGAPWHTKNNVAEQLQFFAFRYLNAPYLWGGKTIWGTDCSGFVQTVYKLVGYQLFRDAYQQAEMGVKVDLSQTTTGDLAFFENEAGKITHVGIMLGNERIIHAHGSVRIDVVDEKGIFNLTTKKYSHKLSKIKRMLR